MLYDIIKDTRTVLKSSDDFRRFLEADCHIEEYISGLILNVIKVADNGNISDWIISHKGKVFYPGEFDYQRESEVKNTLGFSKFKKVFNHFSKLKTSEIELNTDLIILYVEDKNKYGIKGDLVLLGHAKLIPDVNYGKLKTFNTNFEITKRDLYANILKLETPKILLDGSLYPTSVFERSIIDDYLRNTFYQIKVILKNAENDYERYYNIATSIFLTAPKSYITNAPTVLVTDKRTDRPLKLTLNDKIGNVNNEFNKYKDSNEQIENNYWVNLQNMAIDICSVIDTQDINKGLQEISQRIKKLNLSNLHSKRNLGTIKDDLAYLCKEYFLKNLKGNNGSLIVGKFKVFTLEHQKIIKEALEKSDKVAVCVLNNNDSQTLNLRKSMVSSVFPNVKVISAKKNNILTIINNLDFNINKVYCFSKQFKEYFNQLTNTNGVTVKEYLTDKGYTSSKDIIENIKNKDYFLNNTPKQIHKFYNELNGIYNDL